MTEMHNEVIEAVVEYYKDDEDTAADCLLYLMSLKNNVLKYCAASILKEKGRCAYCGRKLEYYTHKEWHTEVDEPPFFEIISELCCPVCDLNFSSRYK